MTTIGKNTYALLPVLIRYQKSQNCVKAAIAFVCTTCKRQLLFALLQSITFVFTSAIENILCTTAIANFYITNEI